MIITCSGEWKDSYCEKFKNSKRILISSFVQVSGAAPLDPQVRGFLREIFGCMILESYGSTECCGSGSATSFANYQLEDGCVGPPQPWNEIKLESVEEMGYHSRDGVGEVCIRGDNIMIGN